jgi:UrcA family protein
MNSLTSLKALCAAAAVAALSATAPAHAQRVVEEITVEGYQGKLPESVKRAATVVSYADLDLSTDWGRDELRKRVRLTARYLCEKLGETDHSPGIVPSCLDQSVRDTMRRVGTIEANAVPRGAAWVQPPPWAAPYPAAWVEDSNSYQAQAPDQAQPSAYQTRTETRTYQSPGYPPQTTTQTTETRIYQPAATPVPAEPYVEY